MTAIARIPISDLVIEGKNKSAASIEKTVWNLNLDQIEPDSGRVLEKHFVPRSRLGPSTYPFETGTVLYSKLRPYLNKVVIAEEDGFATTELVPLRCDPKKIIPAYLAYFLRSPEFLGFAKTLVAGAKMPRMVMSKFWRFTVPVPPIPEQRRIAAILDQAEALRAKRRAALAKLDALAQSIFIEMFGDPVVNPMKWPDTTPLGDVADIASGITIGRNLNGLTTREVPYLAVVNVQDREIRLDVLKTTEATEVEIAKFRLQKNDLLLTEGGDPDKLGRGSLWHGEMAECIHQNHVFRVRLTSREVHPLFLNWLVGSRRGKTYFFKSAKQTTGIASINMTQLRGFPLLLPPMTLQQRFAEQMDLVDHLKADHRASLAHLDALFASLQHRAFRGEL